MLSMSRINLDREALEKLYWKEKLSLSQIAKKLGVTGGAILYWMRKFNIKRRPA